MFSEKDLTQLISDVEKEFSSVLAKAEENKLAKSEEASLAKTEEKKEEEKPEAKEESKEEAKEAKPEEKKEEAHEEHKEEASHENKEDHEEAKEKHEAAPEKDEEGHDYDEEDMKHMHEMYSSMKKGELKAHHDAVRKALDSHEVAKAEYPMAKSEETAVIEVKPEVIQDSKESELLKSEVAVKSAKIEELQKTLDAVTAFVTKLVEKKAAPQGKAITHLETIAKSESTEEKIFNKNEITEILTKKASEPTLKKSDREAINTYYATGQININAISHLLDKQAK